MGRDTLTFDGSATSVSCLEPFVPGGTPGLSITAVRSPSPTRLSGRLEGPRRESVRRGLVPGVYRCEEFGKESRAERLNVHGAPHGLMAAHYQLQEAGPGRPPAGVVNC